MTTTRIPSKLVYLMASSMVGVGLTAWAVAAMNGSANDASEAHIRRDINRGNATDVAEAFLDAWRRRDHDQARDLSAGRQRDAVEERAARDERLTRGERAIKTEAWDRMAAEPLRLRVQATAAVEGLDARVLEGTAEGNFLGNEYIRAIRFMMIRERGGYRVHEMELGQILRGDNALPEGESLEVPGEVKMRGVDVP